MNIDVGSVLDTLDRLTAEAHPDQFPAILTSLASLMVKIAARQMERSAEYPTQEHVEPDRNLSVDETARRMGVSRSWLYKNSPRLDFTIRIGRRLVFSASGLARWIRQRQGR